MELLGRSHSAIRIPIRVLGQAYQVRCYASSITNKSGLGDVKSGTNVIGKPSSAELIKMFEELISSIRGSQPFCFAQCPPIISTLIYIFSAPPKRIPGFASYITANQGKALSRSIPSYASTWSHRNNPDPSRTRSTIFHHPNAI